MVMFFQKWGLFGWPLLAIPMVNLVLIIRRSTLLRVLLGLAWFALRARYRRIGETATAP